MSSTSRCRYHGTNPGVEVQPVAHAISLAGSSPYALSGSLLSQYGTDFQDFLVLRYGQIFQMVLGPNMGLPGLTRYRFDLSGIDGTAPIYLVQSSWGWRYDRTGPIVGKILVQVFPVRTFPVRSSWCDLLGTVFPVKSSRYGRGVLICTVHWAASSPIHSKLRSRCKLNQVRSVAEWRRRILVRSLSDYERSGLGPMNKLPGPVPLSNPSDVDQLAAVATSSLSSGLGPLVSPNLRDAFVSNAPMNKIPSLVGVLSMINDVSVASEGPPLSSFPDDPRDLTYSPPKATTARSKQRIRSSSHRPIKTAFINNQSRDSRGRFKPSSSTKRAPKVSVVSLRGSATLPPDISPVMSELEASRRVVMETAMNTFQNTVGTSASGACPFVFDHPNPFDPNLPPLLFCLLVKLLHRPHHAYG
ncbi:hypothetical protein H4Q26_000888 [Puccinia striiformis f. sp. tritici PST-130]|nr:hypothetical protein H4Q26_000888 [Puccinia striiformis f. sp. tritici PST-130]